MEIPGIKIAQIIKQSLKSEVKKLKKPLKLVTVLIGESSEQLSYVAAKKKAAQELGIKFEFVHFKKTPYFQEFAQFIKTKAGEPETTGMIIQQPLPSQLNTDSLYDYIPLTKEIEGHRRKTVFVPAIGLAVLTIFKYLYADHELSDKLVVNFEKDKNLFKKLIKNEKVVLVGRGTTGGKPIGKTLSAVGINYINVNSNTPSPEDYFKEADVIITAVGKKVIAADVLKAGVILINTGLRREKGRLKGDYDERDIKNVAKYYTTTPGGVGPIDVLYLYKNLIDAARLQK